LGDSAHSLRPFSVSVMISTQSDFLNRLFSTLVSDDYSNCR
jgi:hypothetical protein